MDDTLVSTDWFAAHLGADDLHVIDASWYLPDMDRDPRAEYEAGHIPGAHFVDLDDVSTAGDLPHMAPAPRDFAAFMAGLGIGDGDRVVVYDGAGLFSAGRVWWLFRLMGHRRVAVLDGGLPKWKAEGRPLDDTAPRTQAASLNAARNDAVIRDAAQVLDAAQNDTAQIVDARGAPRFRGEAEEPRKGLRAGHIPGSVNLPYGALLNDDGTMKSGDALRDTVTSAGIDLSRPVITTCGSGVTAAIVYLALARLGHDQTSLYDGSWSEWGARPELPIATGDA